MALQSLFIRGWKQLSAYEWNLVYKAADRTCIIFQILSAYQETIW